MRIGIDVITLGLITGLTYGILAVGLTLIYKSARFVNFAHGNLGALCAVLFAKFVVDWGVPYWIALVLMIALGGALGALVELLILRRLFEAPRLVLVVATIAVSQIFLFFSINRSFQADQQRVVTEGYPIPFDVQWQVGSLVLRGQHVLIMLVIPLIAAALAAFFRFTAYGQAIRASAENADAARLAGISVRRMSTLVWVIAGVLAASTMILLAPLRSVFETGALGPSILVRALGAALIGRMVSMPVAFGAGIALGILENLTFANFTEGGTTDLVVFLVVLGALLFRARDLSRTARSSDAGINFGAESRPLPARIARLPQVQLFQKGTIVAAIAFAVVLPLLPVFEANTQAKAFTFALVTGYALVGLSLTVLTGWAGQVSLGQFALVGVGAFAAARFGADVPVPILLLAAGFIGMAIAVVVGLPAVRIQGLFLAVSTLAFAVVAQSWAFQQETFVGDPAGVFMGRPGFLDSERDVYWFGLAVLILGAFAVRNLRRSGPGRVLIAVRDNDRAARSDGMSATGTRLLSFALSGFMAAAAGVVFALARQNYTATDFAPTESLDVLLMVIIGGLGSIPGALLGAVFLFGLPALFGSSDLIQLLTSGVGVLIVLLFLPGGLVSLAQKLRDAYVERVLRKVEGRPKPPSLVPPWRDLLEVARGRPAVRAEAVPRGTAPADPVPTPAAEGLGDREAGRETEVVG